MAFYCDKDTVLSLFYDGTEVYYQQSKYEVGEVIRTVSPRNEGKLGYSRSLEHFSALLTGDTKTTTTKQNTNNQQSDGRDAQGKTISFSSYSNANATFVFEKEKVDQNVSEHSKLSENIVPIKFLPLRVFLPKKFEPPYVIVRLPETETVQNVLEQALKQYNDVSQNPLQLNLRGYQLYMADDEGQQEEFGILRMDHVASKMGKDFVIVINNDIRQPSMDRGPLVIRLPDGTKATVQFQVGMKINEVVKKVCDKRNLSAPDFHLKVIDGTTLASDTTVQELPNEELQLIPNVEESLIESSDSQTSSVSTALSAFKWKTFEVTYGKRRNFFIGIDGEYIQIFKKKTGFSKEKKETRPFSDLVSIVPGKSSKTFTITWSDGKQDLFESSQRQAIISKIETIQMRRKEHTYL